MPLLRRIKWDYFLWITLTLFLTSSDLFHVTQGKKCPGRCMSNLTECKSKGGKIAGYCTNELACCDFTAKKIGSCGSKMKGLTTAFFRSPEYPEFVGGDLICQFDFELHSNASGIVVDFVDSDLEGRGFVKAAACEADVIYLKGFPNWTPPAHCGIMDNYAAVIDLNSPQTKGMKTLTILALVSSKRYRWNIKISQLFLAGKSYDDEGDADPEQAPKDDDEEESEEEESSRILSILNRGRLETFPIPSYDGQLETSEEDDESSAVFEEPLVVNGEDTNITSVPWQASLRTNISERAVELLGLKNCTAHEGYHFCGGSVISKRHILSATHCFLLGIKLQTWEKLSKVTIVLGDSNTCDNNLDGVQEFRVEKVYYHYAYDNEALLSDVVVIKVKGEIAFTDRVKPIKMAEFGMKFEHSEATVSGWGLTNLTNEEQVNSPEQLQSANDLLIGNFSYCSAVQKHMFETRGKYIAKFKKYSNVFSSLVCTCVRNGTLPKVVGQGDSGGPLVVQSGNYSQEPILAGVCSYMLPITSKTKDPHDVSQYVDFYQSVAYFRRWIDLAMQ